MNPNSEPSKEQLQSVIAQLVVQPADRVESETLEVKSWCKNAKELFEKLGESASCLANAQGGLLILGIEEEGSSRDRFKPCPWDGIDADMLNRKVGDVTKPPVVCTVFDISQLVAELAQVPGAQAFALSIPKSELISPHMTAKGISKIRIGKECRPNFTAEDDRTKAIVPGITMEDLSKPSIDWAMAAHRKQYPRAHMYWNSREDFLAQANLLVRLNNDGVGNPRYAIPLATLLLFGNQAALARRATHCETVVKTPLGDRTLRKNIVECYRELCATNQSLLPSSTNGISPEVLKELVMNAYIHRCYRMPSSISITALPERLVVQSPGGLAGALNVHNLLYSVAVYRNLLLAEGARFIGLCDKVGQGLDIVYRSVVREGFDIPTFEDDGTSFTAEVSTGASKSFKEFVRKRSQSLHNFDEVVALRLLYAKDAPLHELAANMQRGADYAERVLREMQTKLMAKCTPENVWQLSGVLRSDIDNVFGEDQLSFDPDLFGEDQPVMIG